MNIIMALTIAYLTFGILILSAFAMDNIVKRRNIYWDKLFFVSIFWLPVMAIFSFQIISEERKNKQRIDKK